ncbi:hypothetical protein DFQ26_002451, partial [Actinomortierella ambigua]
MTQHNRRSPRRLMSPSPNDNLVPSTAPNTNPAVVPVHTDATVVAGDPSGSNTPSAPTTTPPLAPTHPATTAAADTAVPSSPPATTHAANPVRFAYAEGVSVPAGLPAPPFYRRGAHYCFVNTTTPPRASPEEAAAASSEEAYNR